MLSRITNAITWLLVAGSMAIILGGLFGRPVLLAAVPTGSMLPVLQPGDIIPVIPLMGTQPQIGHIVVFKTEQNSTWIVHRIIDGSARGGFVTRGDGNPTNDEHRVFPRHIAGVVPQVGHVALRIPRIGFFSLERTPLSNPLVAGVAMVFGAYLLIADAGAGLRNIRLRRLARVRMPHPGKKATLAVYAGLGLAVFVVTLLTTLGMGSRQVGGYRIVESVPTNQRLRDTVIANRPKADQITLENPSPLPLIVGLKSEDPYVQWEPGWLVMPPKSVRAVTLTIQSPVLGNHQVELRQALYLPLLPMTFLQYLADMNWMLPALATAVIPVLLVMAVASSDTRVIRQIQQTRLELALRMRLRKGRLY